MLDIDPSSDARMIAALAEDHSDRAPAPADVLNWAAYHSWRDTVWELLSDTIDRRVKRAFLRSPPECIVSDELEWLEEIIRSATGKDVDIRFLLFERLVEKYRAIRVVHGTRAENVAPYYRHGLLPLKPDEFHQKARNMFLGGSFPELTEEDLERAIASVGTEGRAGCVWFDGNEQMLVEDCGHYMLYGSEYLIAIAANLRGHRDYRQVLKALGTPTVFVCDVPLELAGGHLIQELAGTVLEMIFQELLDGKKFTLDEYRHRGMGFPIHKQLPPACLVGHYHPAIQYDPLRW